MDPAAGTTSRQRWQPTGPWVTSDEPAWPALVDEDLWERVSARITNNRGPHRRRPRQIQRELAAARATTTWEHEHQHARPLSAEDIHQVLKHAGDLAGLLAEAERETRARLYRTLDLVLNLNPVGDLRPSTFGCSKFGGGGRI